MSCQICKKQPATVHIIEIPEGLPTLPPADPGEVRVEKRHLCEACARNLRLPAATTPPKGLVNIWKLLQKSARKAREEGGLACPECGMTLAEFRSKGRLGCAQDYQVFRQHLVPLLQRIHHASDHVGRVPGAPVEDLERQRHLTALRAKLAEAIREEAYESAAELRDEIQALEGRRESAS